MGTSRLKDTSSLALCQMLVKGTILNKYINARPTSHLSDRYQSFKECIKARSLSDVSDGKHSFEGYSNALPTSHLVDWYESYKECINVCSLSEKGDGVHSFKECSNARTLSHLCNEDQFFQKSIDAGSLSDVSDRDLPRLDY